MPPAPVLQEGVYHAPGARPGAFFALLFLRVNKNFGDEGAGAMAHADDVARTFAALWEMYQGLKAGQVADLPGHPVPPGDLSVLVGYGRKAFEVPGARAAIPEALRDGSFRSPLPTGGGPLLLGGGLRYGDDVHLNLATEEIAVQFIADTNLAVNRAIIETWKLLEDRADPATGSAALQLASFQTGFQRDDGRSWIDFHDGISNMRSDERLGAIAIKPGGVPGEEWTEGGTYLAFIRVGANLMTWRKLSREQQEILVGRDKLTGCAFQRVDEAGKPQTVAGCPFAGSVEVIESGNVAFREPPADPDAVIARSHVQRANHHQGPISGFSSARVFRQGYEFLEPLDGVPGFRVGLNFVSFQDTPRRLVQMLTQPGWLGKINFGGDPDAPLPGMDRFLTVRAAGVYVAPPVVEGEAFPGARALFGY